jgi:hypothetical protein
LSLSLRYALREVSKVDPGQAISVRAIAGTLGFIPPISLVQLIKKIMTVKVLYWPLGDGEYEAGTLVVNDIPISDQVSFTFSTDTSGKTWTRRHAGPAGF